MRSPATQPRPDSVEVVAWECIDIFFGFPEVRELRTGVLDADAEHVFTNGHCHSFAEAIRRLTRIAQLVFAFDFLDSEKDGDVQGHVLVRIGGRYLDARGWVEQLFADEDGNAAFESRWDRVEEIGPCGWLAKSSGWLDLRVADTLPFAAALLERLEVPTDNRAPTGPAKEEDLE